ncbi:hypothetical protein SAMD00019534_030080 [Acytostelium subglobosum LB1]|uniref:hypothetical protein n=1 Tax=Acytostelium subglobosum LB1 TaxID=1410327 RepID=UPI000644E295|nr:hypothetical protein SAMD00019534_030080 [Acytostelium subglobosum LB1]GAM19833.1 hypothetical protein SAMD00019534_030080 [Acytostelium subglobosum LB1]|eukprot:XP_012756595.1 hypothetical protein SAMD00019534_030080 [Acytostelium subglobosum LB1]
MNSLSKPEQLNLLFEYATIEVAEEGKRRDTYPYIASEILCMDINEVIDAIYKDEKYLAQLYSMLDQPAINPSLSSNISKVAINFLSRKTVETMTYIKKQDKIIDKFITHLDQSAIVDILLKIITIEEFQGGAGTLEWLEQANLIGGIVAKLDPAFDSDFHENAAFLLSEIVESSGYVESPLIAELGSEQTIQKLYGFMFSESPLGSCFINGLTVMIKLMRKHKDSSIEVSAPLEKLDPLFKQSVTHSQTLNELLKKPTSDLTFTTTTGPMSPPLGFYRLKIIEFFTELVSSQYLCIDKVFVDHGILSTILDLFFQYPWNNILHNQVGQICEYILTASANDELKLALIKDAKLVERIIAVDKENKKAVGPIQFGFMGYLNQIARTINRTQKDKAFIAENAEWTTYVEQSLQPALENEDGLLGDFKLSLMMAQQDNDDDDDQVFVHGSLDNAGQFHGFQSNHIYEDDVEYDEEHFEENGGHHDGDDDEEVLQWQHATNNTGENHADNGFVAKSSVVFEIKPVDAETDMSELENTVRSINMDGLMWGNSELLTVGYGIQKLSIGCVVVDSLVSTDDLEEKIASLEDIVQSVDIVLFNKF